MLKCKVLTYASILTTPSTFVCTYCVRRRTFLLEDVACAVDASSAGWMQPPRVAGMPRLPQSLDLAKTLRKTVVSMVTPLIGPALDPLGAELSAWTFGSPWSEAISLALGNPPAESFCSTVQPHAVPFRASESTYSVT